MESSDPKDCAGELEPCSSNGVTICPAGVTKGAQQRFLTGDDQEDAISTNHGQMA